MPTGILRVMRGRHFCVSQGCMQQLTRARLYGGGGGGFMKGENLRYAEACDFNQVPMPVPNFNLPRRRRNPLRSSRTNHDCSFRTPHFALCHRVAPPNSNSAPRPEKSTKAQTSRASRSTPQNPNAPEPWCSHGQYEDIDIDLPGSSIARVKFGSRGSNRTGSGKPWWSYACTGIEMRGSQRGHRSDESKTSSPPPPQPAYPRTSRAAAASALDFHGAGPAWNAPDGLGARHRGRTDLALLGVWGAAAQPGATLLGSAPTVPISGFRDDRSQSITRGLKFGEYLKIETTRDLVEIETSSMYNYNGRSTQVPTSFRYAPGFQLQHAGGHGGGETHTGDEPPAFSDVASRAVWTDSVTDVNTCRPKRVQFTRRADGSTQLFNSESERDCSDFFSARRRPAIVARIVAPPPPPQSLRRWRESRRENPSSRSGWRAHRPDPVTAEKLGANVTTVRWHLQTDEMTSCYRLKRKGKQLQAPMKNKKSEDGFHRHTSFILVDP
ncbi:hypothetical protein DFH06DRAFT_1129478 [Mycena polygramma]|nr:hypothetical protein DFH06DRAFT_1129478 [Mycena polygramma]